MMLNLDIHHQPFPPEDENLEYKSKETNGIKREIGAFLNNAVEHGITKSYIVMGVKDGHRTTTRPYLYKNPDYRHKFEEILSNWVNIDYHPDASKYVHIKYKNGLFYIEVDSDCYHVFSANVSKNKGHFQFYRRIGSLSEPVNFMVARRMLLDTIPKDIDYRSAYIKPLTFTYFKQSLKKHNLPYNDLKQYDGLYKPNTNIPTMTAQVLSHENRASTSLVAYDGPDIRAPFLDTKVFSGSVIKQIDQVSSYIEAHNNKLSRVIGLTRKGRTDYPKIAIREALINAEVHRMYDISDAVIIRVFKGRLTISSPGVLPDGMSPDEAYHRSDPTNPHLFGIFKLLGYVEHIGNGLKLIKDSYSNFYPAPKLQSKNGRVTVTLYNRNHKDIYVQVTKIIKRNSKPLIKNLEINKFVNRRKIEHLYGIKSSQATRIINKLVKVGFLIRVGKGRATKYKKGVLSAH